MAVCVGALGAALILKSEPAEVISRQATFIRAQAELVRAQNEPAKAAMFYMTVGSVCALGIIGFVAVVMTTTLKKQSEVLIKHHPPMIANQPRNSFPVMESIPPEKIEYNQWNY